MKRAIIVVLFFTLLVGGGLKEVAASGQAWAVIDADTGRLLEGHNENVRLPIASLTKIWTAFTFIESVTEPADVIISPQAASAEGSSLYLSQGMEIGADALLTGLMLRSGNIMPWKMISFAQLLPQRIIVTRGRIKPIAGVTSTASFIPNRLRLQERPVLQKLRAERLQPISKKTAKTSS